MNKLDLDKKWHYLYDQFKRLLSKDDFTKWFNYVKEKGSK